MSEAMGIAFFLGFVLGFVAITCAYQNLGINSFFAGIFYGLVFVAFAAIWRFGATSIWRRPKV